MVGCLFCRSFLRKKRGVRLCWKKSKPQGPEGWWGSSAQGSLSAGRDVGWDTPPSVQAPPSASLGEARNLARGEAQPSSERPSTSEDASTPCLPASPPRPPPPPPAAPPLAGRAVARAPLQHPRTALAGTERAAGATRAREATIARLARNGRDGRAPAPPQARVLDSFRMHAPKPTPEPPSVPEAAAAGPLPSALCHLERDWYFVATQSALAPHMPCALCHILPPKAIKRLDSTRVSGLNRHICLNLATLTAARRQARQQPCQ